MALAAVEDAIRAWVKSASGLNDSNVYFADQKVERPTGPFITIRIDGPTSLGAVDPLITYYDAGRPAGMEIELRVEGQRSLLVSIQVWQAPTVVGTMSPSAVDLAATVRTALRLPTIRDALGDAGLSPYNVEPIRNLGRVLGTAFDGRAQFDVEFYWVENASEFTGYVNELDVGETVSGGAVVDPITDTIVITGP
jgi:hypothetical protein